MPEHDADVIVVGAGLSGLTAAERLDSVGVNTLVLEAQGRVGGRTLNGHLPDGQAVELGGQWVSASQPRMKALADRLGIERFGVHIEGDKLLERGGRVRRWSGRLPTHNPLTLSDLGQAQLRLERSAASVPLEAPWRSRDATVWDEQTLATWLRHQVRTPRARALLDLACTVIFAASPRDISLLHALFYFRAGGGFQHLVETGGAAGHERFVGGSQRVSLCLADRLRKRLRVGEPVVAIRHDADGAAVQTTETCYNAQRVIVALPLTLAGRIRYEPQMPAARDGLTQRVSQGSVIKAMAVYPEPFWRRHGLSGQAITDVGPVASTFDNSPPAGSSGVLLGFITGRAARQAAAMPTEKRYNLVVKTFTRLFGSGAAQPEAYLEHVWADDPYTRGCYASYLSPGVWSDFGHALRPPVGTIYWAGADVASAGYGHMEGAVATGEDVADKVQRSLNEPDPSIGATSD